MFSSVRRSVGAVTAAALAGCAVAVAVPASAQASSTITRPTSYVWTGSNALSECTAQGQYEVAHNGWDGYSCKPDASVGPTAIRLWVIIWVGCPTC
jgi:hypothetical protein